MLHHRPGRGRPARLHAGLIASAALLALLAVVAVLPATHGGGAMHELNVLRLPRPGAARLSITVRYVPCLDAPAGGPPLSRCGGEPQVLRDELPRIARIGAATRTGDLDTLHAQSVLALVWSTRENFDRRAISSLQRLARLGGDSVAVLVDLSAAHLERAERRGTARDLLEAAEAAERALRGEPANASARFNLALALDWLGLVDAAIREWRGFLEAEPSSAWSAEARHRIAVLEGVATPLRVPARTAPVAEVEAFALRAPQEARMLAWNHLLGEWGDAVNHRNAMTANQRLMQAEAIGRALVRRRGDATTRDAVDAIRALRGDTRTLARAHRDYVRALAAYERNDWAGSDSLLAGILGRPGASRPLRGWARVFLGAVRAYEKSPGAERLLREAMSDVDTAAAPALAARARWNLATTVFFHGRYREALDLYRSAAQLFGSAGEPGHRGAVEGYAANTAFQLGDHQAGFDVLHAALMDLRPERASRWRHAALWIAADGAAGQGMPRVAARIADELVATAERMPRLPEYGVEAHALRARVRAAAGNRAGAVADAGAARAALGMVASRPLREWLLGDVDLSEAVATLAAGRIPPGRTLDEAVLRMQTRVSRLVPALTARAEASLAASDTAAAIRDVAAVIALFEAQRDSIVDSPLRASITEAARGVFDRMVMLRLRSGRPEEALEYLERGRLAFTLRGQAPAYGARLPGPPPGQTALDLALVGDTLVAWVVDAGSVSVEITRVDREALLRATERVRLAFENGAAEGVVRPELERLYEWLIRPVEERLGPPSRPLLLVADGEVAGIPFAALRDRRNGHYLVEDHPLRWAATLHEGRQGAGPASGQRRALVVGNPAFDPRSHPGLETLRGAAVEARQVAGMYPHATLLSDTGATAAAFLAELHSAAVVHYAGHAVFDDERPERSYLALAGRASDLTAADLDSLDLRGTRLVVLSACETLRPRAGRTGGFAGLSGAFLHAGARGVLGSLWKADDAGVRPLMLYFHREYLRTGDAAGALQAAQLALMRSRDPTLRTPAVWATFRYAGD